MGLLDDPFGRAEINRLKNLLVEKNVELSGLSLNLAQQLKRIDELSQQSEVLQSKNNTLSIELLTNKTSKERIETYFEEFRKKTNDQHQINKKIIDELRKQCDLLKIEFSNKNSEFENKEKEVQKFLYRLAEIEQKSQISEERYQDREQKLAEKSERLQA